MKKRALVFGRAVGVWDEITAAKAICDFDVVIAVGSAGVDYNGRIDHWVSFHIDLLPHWTDQRVKAGGSRVDSYWTAIYQGSPLYIHFKHPLKRVHCNGGSSGLIGAMVGLELAEHVVLAGIPMDPDRHQYDHPAKAWDEALKHRKAWMTYLPKIGDRVRSMSGWTRELLGEPTPEWLGLTNVA